MYEQLYEILAIDDHLETNVFHVLATSVAQAVGLAGLIPGFTPISARAEAPAYSMPFWSWEAPNA